MTQGPKERAGLRLPPVKNTPVSSAMKSAKPMPIGARKVPLCFSAASMRMVKTSMAVRNISMNSPLTIEVPPPRVVETFMAEGKRHETIPAAAIAPRIWPMKTSKPRTHLQAPIRQRARVTCEEVRMIQPVDGHELDSLLD